MQCMSWLRADALDHVKDFVRTMFASKVAEAIFDDGRIRFYINGEGYSKVSNPVPCATWMMKPGFDADKALFQADATDEEIMTFADAC